MWPTCARPKQELLTGFGVSVLRWQLAEVTACQPVIAMELCSQTANSPACVRATVLGSDARKSNEHREFNPSHFSKLERKNKSKEINVDTALRHEPEDVKTERRSVDCE